MTRRDANWLIFRAAATVGGSEFFESWLRAAQNKSAANAHNHQRDSPAPPEPERWINYQPKFFSREEFEMLDAFTALLIPTDDTPGAREAHVAAFTDFVVNAAGEYAPETQRDWRAAMEYLRSRKFAQLSASEQLAFIEQISAPEHDPSQQHAGFPAYRLIKEMTVHAFYTSRIGLIDVLEYKGMAYLTEFPACNHPEHHKV